MATISKRDETLIIELSALEKSEAMHGDLEIPTAAISSIEVLDDADVTVCLGRGRPWPSGRSRRGTR